MAKKLTVFIFGPEKLIGEIKGVSLLQPSQTDPDLNSGSSSMLEGKGGRRDHYSLHDEACNNRGHVSNTRNPFDEIVNPPVEHFQSCCLIIRPFVLTSTLRSRVALVLAMGKEGKKGDLLVETRFEKDGQGKEGDGSGLHFREDRGKKYETLFVERKGYLLVRLLNSHEEADGGVEGMFKRFESLAAEYSMNHPDCKFLLTKTVKAIARSAKEAGLMAAPLTGIKCIEPVNLIVEDEVDEGPVLATEEPSEEFGGGGQRSSVVKRASKILWEADVEPCGVYDPKKADFIIRDLREWIDEPEMGFTTTYSLTLKKVATLGNMFVNHPWQVLRENIEGIDTLSKESKIKIWSEELSKQSRVLIIKDENDKENQDRVKLELCSAERGEQIENCGGVQPIVPGQISEKEGVENNTFKEDKRMENERLMENDLDPDTVIPSIKEMIRKNTQQIELPDISILFSDDHQLQLPFAIGEHKDDYPISREIIYSLGLRSIGAYFHHQKKSTKEAKPTDSFVRFIRSMITSVPTIVETLFSKLVLTKDYSYESTMITKHFFNMLFSDKYADLLGFFKKRMAEEGGLRKDYADWFLSCMFKAESFVTIDREIHRMLVEPFKAMKIDGTLRYFYDELLEKQIVLKSSFELVSDLMRTPYIQKENRIKWLCETLLSENLTRNVLARKTLDHIFSTPEPFPTSETDPITTKNILECISKGDGIGKHNKQYEGGITGETTSFSSSDPALFFLSTFSSDSVFHRLVVLVKNYCQKNQTAIENKSNPKTYLEPEFRRQSVYFRYVTAMTEFLKAHTQEKKIVGKVLSLFKEMGPEELELMEGFDFEGAGKPLRMRVREEIERLERFTRTVEEIKLILAGTPQVSVLFSKFQFYKTATKELGSLMNEQPQMTMDKVEQDERFKDLQSIMKPETQIIVSLKNYSQFINDVGSRENTSVAEFIKNVQEVTEIHRKIYQRLIQSDHNFKYSDYNQYFKGLIKDKRKAEIMQTLKVLGLTIKESTELLEKAARFEGYSTLQTIFENDSLNILFNWEVLKTKKTPNAKLFNSLNKSREVALEVSNRFKGDFSYRALSKEIDPESLTARSEIQIFNSRLLDLISQSEEMFKFLRDNQNSIVELLKSECEVDYNTLILRLETAQRDLGFLVNVENHPADSIINQLFRISPDARLDKVVEELLKHLQTLILVRMKITGDFKGTLLTLLHESHFTFVFDSKSEEFTFYATKPRYTSGAETGTPTPKTPTEENPAAPQNITQSNDYVFDREDLNDLFTKASIICSDREASNQHALAERKGQSPNEVEDKNSLTVKCFRDLGEEIKKLNKNLCRLYEIGIINKVLEQAVNLLQFKKFPEIFPMINKKFICVLQSEDRFGLQFERVQALRITNDSLSELVKDLESQYHNLIEQKDCHLLTYFTKERMCYLIDFLKAEKKVRIEEKYSTTISLLEDATNNPKVVQEALQYRRIVINSVESSFYEVAVVLRGFFTPVLDQKVKSTFGFLSDKVSVCNLTDSTRKAVNPFAEKCETNPYDFILRMLSSEPRQQLNLCQILYCTRKTTSHEVKAFVCRCFLDSLERVYVLLNPAALTEEVSADLCFTIESFQTSYQNKVIKKLIIFNNSESNLAFSNPERFQSIDDKISSLLLTQNWRNYPRTYIHQLERLLIVHSAQAGAGKTHFIIRDSEKQRQKPAAQKLITLSIAGEINNQSLGTRLKIVSETAKTDHFDLHVKLDYIENLNEHRSIIDFQLFCLCFAGRYISESGIVNLHSQLDKIYIELGNSNKEKLLKSLELIQTLEIWESAENKVLDMKRFYQLPSFSPNAIEYNSNPKSSVQVMAKFLSLPTPDEAIDTKTSLSEVEFKRLYNGFFTQRLLSQPSYKGFTFFSFVLFVNVVAELKLEIDSCQAFVPAAQPQLNKEIDLQKLKVETCQEILTFAASMISLHSPDVVESQRRIVSIFDNHSEKVKQLLKEQGETLRTLINKSKWNTCSLYLPLISNNTFIPVVQEFSVMNRDSRRGQRLASIRYLNKLKENFEAMGGDHSAQSGGDHTWYVFLLSKLTLFGQERRSYDEIQKLTKTFDYAKKGGNKGNEQSSQEEQKNKRGFSLTRQTFMKLTLMIFKAKITQPIIIMGESGCGKTYLSQFLVKGLLRDELRMETLYSGYSEDNLISFIKQCIDSAKNLPANKRLWVFFDEFNTTAVQSLIADIILDRVLPVSDPKYSTVPDNMLFIACCNPYCVKLDTKELDIGLVPPKKSSMLSHVVHPIPERLLALVWDFGQLSEEDELSHIHTMVKSEAFFNGVEAGIEPIAEQPKSFNSKSAKAKKEVELSLLVFKCHNTVRKIEERSGVSLRDVKRVFIFYRWFLDQLREMQYYVNNEPELVKDIKDYWIIRNTHCRELAAAICSVSLCYYLRLNGQYEHQQSLKEIIYNWCSHCADMEEISWSDVNDTLSKVAGIYLHNLKNTSRALRDDITLNTPFKENFITLLACYAVKVPMIIVGAPGTSKTLSTNTLLDALDAKNNTGKAVSDLFSNFDKVIKLYYGGSETSTSEGVQKVFDKAEKLYMQKLEKQAEAEKKGLFDHYSSANFKIETPIIFFDELGLAEQSKFNPLKVMHSKLEENLGRIPFVGISNWKPDQSKLNRMICLYRPDLSREDLVSIFKGTLGNMDQRRQESLNPVFESLAETYLNFRKWQKSIRKLGSGYHSNFHGSRDIYGTFRLIYAEIEQNRDKLLQGEVDKQTQAILSAVLKAAERNLNGECYIFSDSEGSSDKSLDHGILPQSCLESIVDSNGLVTGLLSPISLNAILTPEVKAELKLVRLDDLKDVYSLTAEEIERIEQNPMAEFKDTFSLSSSEIFKLFLFDKMNSNSKITLNLSYLDFGKMLKDKTPQELVLQSISDPNSRFLILRSECKITEDIFVKLIRSGIKDKTKFVDWRVAKEDSKTDDLLSYLKTYISMGYTVVMKNLDSLYGGLYDLFNQKYQDINGKKSCHLYYGQTKHTVEVSPDFKCIVMLSSNSTMRAAEDIEKIHPAPFLNRFEKYFILLSRILTDTDFQSVMRARVVAAKMAKGKTSWLVGLTQDLVISSAINENSLLSPFSMVTPDREIIFKLMGLATSNYLFSGKLQPSEITLYQKTHEIISLEGLLSFLNQFSTPVLHPELQPFENQPTDPVSDASQSENILVMFSPHQPLTQPIIFKNIVFTFTTATAFQQVYARLQEDRPDLFYGVILKQASELERVPLSDRVEALRKLSPSQHEILLVVFNEQRDLPFLSSLRGAVDDSGLQARVVFLVHVSIYHRERKILQRTSGISFWNNWKISVIEHLEGDLDLQSLLKIKNTPILTTVLGEEEDESAIELDLQKNSSRDVGVSTNPFEEIPEPVFLTSKSTSLGHGGSYQKTRNWVFKRAIVREIEMLGHRLVNKDFDTSRVKDIFERKGDRPDSKISKWVIKILRDGLRTAITDEENSEVMLSDSNLEIADLLKEDDFRSIDQLLGLAFFRIFEKKSRIFFDKLNTECRNISTCIIGLTESESLRNLQTEFKTWMIGCVEKSSNIVDAPVKNRQQMIARMRQGGGSNEPEAYNLPFKNLYDEIATIFIKFQEDYFFRKDRLELVTKDLVRAEYIMQTGEKTAAVFSAAFKEKTIYLRDQVMKEEFNVVTILQRLSGEAEGILTLRKPKVEFSNPSVTNLLLCDILKRLFYQLFKEETKREQIMDFIKACNAARNPFYQKFKLDKNEILSNLICPALVCLCFEKSARFLISIMRTLKSLNQNIDTIINEVSSSSPRNQDTSPAVNYSYLDNLVSRLNMASIVPDLRADRAALNSYNQLLSTETSTTEDQDPSSPGDCRSFLKLMFSMLKYFGETCGQSAENAARTADKKKIHLSNLQRLEEKFREPTTLKEIMTIGEKIFTEFLSLREFDKTMPVSIIQDFSEAWILNENSFSIVINNPLLTSLSFFTDYEYLSFAKTIANCCFQMVGFNLDLVKDLMEPIIQKSGLESEGIKAVNSLVETCFRNLYTNERYKMLLETIVENFFINVNLERFKLGQQRSFFKERIYEDSVKMFWSQRKENNLPMVLAIVSIRLCFEDQTIKDVESGKYCAAISKVFEDKLNPGEILDICLQNADSFPFLYFLQCVNRIHSKIEVARHVETVARVTRSTFDPADKTRVVFLNDEGVKKFMALEKLLDERIQRYHIGKTPANLQMVKDVIQEDKEEPATDQQLYFVGVLAINKILAFMREEDQAQYENIKAMWKVTFTELQQTYPVDSRMHTFCRFIINLGNPQSIKCSSIFLEKKEPEVDIRINKLLAQFALMTLCFPNQMGYEPNAWKSWKTEIKQDRFKCRVVVSDRLTNYADRWDHILDVRMLDPDYQFNYGPQFPPNLGVYLCSCKFMYTFGQCGYPMNTATCVSCKKTVGGNNHMPLPGMVHVPTLDGVKSLMDQEYSLQAATYTPHDFLNTDSVALVNLRALEIPHSTRTTQRMTRNAYTPQVYQDYRRNVTFRHLMDHLYLASLHWLMTEEDKKKFLNLSSDMVSLGNNKKTIPTMKQVFRDKLTHPLEYFLYHVKNDFDTIKDLVKFNSPFEIFQWFSGVQSQMAEMIMKGEAPDPTSKLYISWTRVFSHPGELIQAVEKKAKDMASQTQKISAVAVQEIVARRINYDVEGTPVKDPEDYKLYTLFFKHNQFSREKIPKQLDEFCRGLPGTYSLLQNVYKYRNLLKVFPRILAANLEISQYITRKYSGRLTQQQAFDSLLLSKSGPRDKRDRILEQLYHDYLEAWRLVGELQHVHPEIFEFRFMCQQGLELQHFINRTTDSNTATIFDFLVVDVKEEKFNGGNFIFFKAILQSLVENFHNKIVKLARRCIDASEENARIGGGDKENKLMSRFQKKNLVAEMKIKDCTESDFVYFDQDIDEMALENVGIDILKNRDSVYLIDYENIQSHLAAALNKPLIVAEEGASLLYFEFDKGLTKTKINEVNKFFSYLPKLPLNDEMKNFLENSIGTRGAPGVRQVLLTITDMCELLHQSLEFSDTQTPVLDLVRQCEKNTELRDKILQQATLLKIPKEFTLHHIEAVHENLQSKDFDNYLRENCSTKLDMGQAEGLKQLLQCSPDSLTNEVKLELERLWREAKEQAFECYPDTDGKALSTTIADLYVQPDPVIIGEEIAKHIGTLQLGQVLTLKWLNETFPPVKPL